MSSAKRIVFDGNHLSRLYRKDEVRTGVFFTVMNVFEELADRKECEIILYANTQNYCDVVEGVKKRYPDKRIPVLFQDIKWFTGLSEINRKIMRRASDKGSRLLKLIGEVLPYFSYVMLLFSRRARKEIEEYQFFVSLFYYPPEFICRNKIKKVIFVHDLIPYIYPEYFPAMKRIWPKFYLRPIVEKADNDTIYLCNSKSTRDDFLRFTKGKVNEENIHITYLASSVRINEKPVQADIFKKYGIGSKYVLTLCTLEPRKNLLRIAQSFVRFVEDNSITDLILIMGGAKWNSFSSQFEKKYNDNNWKKYIKHIGYVDDEDLPYLYSNAEWFVYTSQYEGFGLPLLEAMGCGCPVIGSSSSSIPEVVGDAGILIPWDSTEQHIKAYEKMYFDGKLRQSYKEKGIKQAEKFSWSRTVDNILMQLK